MYLPDEFATTAARRHPRGVRPPTVTVFPSRSLASCFEPSIVTLVADLSLGLVRPNAIATQVCQQLGLVPAASRGTAAADAPQTADAIGALIDREAAGFAPVLAAHPHVERVLATMAASGGRYRLVLIPPCTGTDLGEENRAFLHLLAEQCAAVELWVIGQPGLRFSAPWVVVEAPGSDRDRDAASAPASDAFYVPGLLDRAQADRLTDGEPANAGLIPLCHGLWAVPPEWRRPRPSSTSAEREALRLLLDSSDIWLRAHAIARLQLRPHLSALIGFGWRAMAEGGHQVALDLLGAAQSMTSDSLMGAQLDALIAGTRLGLEDFAALAAAALPPPSVPPKLRVQLLQHKAWGLAMTGRLPEAQVLFEEASTLLAQPSGIPSREYLYLLNIAAFSLFRRGQIRDAFALEHQMSEGIARLPSPDQHLEYVSCMNLGRLHLRQKHPDQAELFFERANATHNGLRTLGDRIAMHLYRARVAELRDDTTETKRHFVRAALTWISDPLPESLSSRTARLLLGNKRLPRHLWLPAINDFFARRLTELFGAPASASTTAPTICGSSCLARPSHAEVVSLATGAVAISTEGLESPQDHPSHRALRGQLREILAAENDCAELATAATIYVDDQNGTEPTRTADEAIAMAVRLGVPRARVAGRVVFDHDCGDEDRVSWSARLAPAVLKVVPGAASQTVVVFRRYQGPRALDLLEAPVVLALAGGERDLASVATETGWRQPELVLALRRLEQERIVTLRVKSPVHDTDPAPLPSGGPLGRSQAASPAIEALFQDIYTHHLTIVWKTVHAFTNNKQDQEDLFQEILIALWEALPHFQARSKLTTYVYRVAHRRALNWKRSQRRYHNKLADYEHGWPELTIMSPDPTDQARLEWLYQSINTLRAIDRTICLLYLDGLSYREMSEIVGMTEDNIGIRVHRCKRHLTEMLNRTNEESLRSAVHARPSTSKAGSSHAPARAEKPVGAGV